MKSGRPWPSQLLGSIEAPWRQAYCCLATRTNKLSGPPRDPTSYWTANAVSGDGRVLAITNYEGTNAEAFRWTTATAGWHARPASASMFSA